MSPQTKSPDKMVDIGITQSAKESRWRVNRKLVPLKMFYFFFYGASGSFIPFVTVYLKYLRLSASEAGLITGLAMLLAMMLRAFIGMLADKLSAKKTALLICCLGFGAVSFAMWFVPRRVLLPKHSANSSSDNFIYISQQKQQQYYSWICLTDDGKEVCHYPPHPGSYTCQIYEELTFANISEYNHSDYVDSQKDRVVNATEGSFDGHRSEINAQGREWKYLDTFVSYEHINKTIPCFYLDVHHQTSEMTFTAQIEYQAVKSSADKYRHATISPSAASSTDGTVSCLLNCSRRLVGSFMNEDSGATLQSLNDSTRSSRDAHQALNLDLAFSLSFALLIIGKSTYAASTSLTDAVAYTILGPYSLKWGQQRLWGTVGTGMVVLTITLVNNNRQVESFAGIFIACLALSIMTFLTGFLKLRADKAPKKKMFFKDIRKLLSTGSVRLFLCKLLFYGMMSGTAQNFFFWFLVDLRSGQTTLGVCLLLYCVSSVILLRYSRLILHKLGQIKVMYLTLIAYSIRFLVLSFLTSAWQALPAEILHGVTYSLFWAAASSTASIVAPPGTQATSQGLAGAMYWDLGRGIGIVVTGQFLQLFGARWTFRAYSITCVGILPVLWMLDRVWSLPKSNSEKREDNEEQDGEVGTQLLTSITMNDIPLNNNFTKGKVLDNESVQEMSPINDNTGRINDPEREIYIVQSTLGAEDVRNTDLETSIIDEAKNSVENTRERDYKSITHSMSNNYTPCTDCGKLIGETCPHEATNGTVAISTSPQLRPGSYTDTTENNSKIIT